MIDGEVKLGYGITRSPQKKLILLGFISKNRSRTTLQEMNLTDFFAYQERLLFPADAPQDYSTVSIILKTGLNKFSGSSTGSTIQFRIIYLSI
jgi:hypothetical protein